MSPREFETAATKCHLCKVLHTCTYPKAAHVPLYAWVCELCRDEWVAE